MGFPFPERVAYLTALLAFSATVLMTTGCTNRVRHHHDPDVIVVEHSFQGERKSKAELRDLRRRAREGDGAAAYELFAYYSLGRGQNTQLSERFLDRSVTLDFPLALYMRAVDIWMLEEEPDVVEAHALVSRAIALGFRDESAHEKGFATEEDLLEELETALETGAVPAQTRFRFFTEQRSKAEE